MNKQVLVLEHIHKSYMQGKTKLHILQGANLVIHEGEVVALVGPSGAGKSTLLQIAGLLDHADSGTVTINGTTCTHADDATRTRLRRDEIGFVYQAHHLLPEFTALENVLIPQMVSGISKKVAKKHALEVLKFLGLSRRVDHRPQELSGGEQQRVAIARAIVNRPSLLLADEPTGNLDPHTAEDVFQLLLHTAENIGLAVLIVTHNYALASRTHRTITLKEGAIVTTKKTA